MEIKCPYCEFVPGKTVTAVYWKIVGMRTHLNFKHGKKMGTVELKNYYRIK